MRQILFKGKRKDNSEWVYGDILHGCGMLGDTIRQGDGYGKTGYYAVETSSVGQFTGLTDKNGTKIFEGDILDVEYDPGYGGVAAERIGTFEVVFEKGSFMKKKIGGVGLFHFIPSDVCRVIGNRSDNTELINGGKQ